MRTVDGLWTVDVGGFDERSKLRWYRLVGENYVRNFPSLEALLAGVVAAGVDVADLREHTWGVVGA